MIRISMYAVVAMTLSACSVFGPFQSNAPQSIGEGDDSLISNHVGVAELVATDLVGVLSQIDIIEPAQTTLYASRPDDRLGEKMVKALQNAGYRLRLAQAEQEPRLSYVVEKDNVASGYTVIVSAGLVKVKRRYDVNTGNNTVQPASSIYVLGADGDNIQIDDSIFDFQQPELPPAYENSGTETQVAMAIPVPAKPELVKQPLENPTPSNIARNPDLKPSTKLNMYETRRSNFEELLEQFNTVRREVMVFPNDSLVMGIENKQLAHEMATVFQSDTDVVSVIGCSHGKSAIDDGNRKLANGRANRVREEFLIAGIDSELVLHEACWANVHFDEMMPRRGVVVTHKRKLN